MCTFEEPENEANATLLHHRQLERYCNLHFDLSDIHVKIICLILFTCEQLIFKTQSHFVLLSFSIQETSILVLSQVKQYRRNDVITEYPCSLVSQ